MILDQAHLDLMSRDLQNLIIIKKMIYLGQAIVF